MVLFPAMRLNAPLLCHRKKVPNAYAISASFESTTHVHPMLIHWAQNLTHMCGHGLIIARNLRLTFLSLVTYRLLMYFTTT